MSHEFHMTDSKRMLASVTKMVEAGNEVIFGKRSWIRCPKTKKRIELKKEGHIYVMEVMFKAGGVRKKGKIVVDSGVAENVMPWSWLPEAKEMAKQEGIKFVAANGESMGNYGRKEVEFEPIYAAGEDDDCEQVFKRHA